MPLFTSRQEKRLWAYAGLVLAAIIATLAFGYPLVGFLGDQNLQAVLFLLGMILTAIAILSHGLKSRPSKTELALWLGLAAIFIMLFLRLGLAERSHLIEYSVLTIFVHKALMERFGQKGLAVRPALMAVLITLTISVIDECIQIFIPNRVFDPEDIVFNGLAVTITILASLALQWIRKKVTR